MDIWNAAKINDSIWLLIFLGILWNAFIDGSSRLGPLAKILDDNLGPQGAMNNIVRWLRQLILPLVSRIGLNLAFQPTETVADLNEKGLSIFSEFQFRESFAVDNMIKVILDCGMSMIGWIIYWFIARSRNNRVLFVKKRSVISTSTRSMVPEIPAEDTIKTRYEAIIKKLEQLQQ